MSRDAARLEEQAAMLRALDRARREVARLEGILQARADPKHEHKWWGHDGSWCCFGCRIIVDNRPVESSPGDQKVGGGDPHAA